MIFSLRCARGCNRVDHATYQLSGVTLRMWHEEGLHSQPRAFRLDESAALRRGVAIGG